MTDKYKDIINLERPVSQNHLPMPRIKRAAQFAPFAALTGHLEALNEAGRLTERRIELDNYIKDELDIKLQIILREIDKKPRIKIKYFKKDERKPGGAYINLYDRVIKIDVHKKNLYMKDGSLVPILDIIRIDGELFDG